MKKYFTLLTALVITFQLAAQDDPKSEFAKDFLPVWTTSTNIAVQVAEAMPEDLYDFKPNDSSMTFREQIVHMAFTSYFLTAYFTQEEKPAYSEPEMSGKSKEEVVSYLKENIAKATGMISELTDAQLNEKVMAFSGEMLKRYMTIYFVQDHLTNHRAKANLYIRINNIKPPEYGFF